MSWKSDIHAASSLIRPKLQVHLFPSSNVNDEFLKEFWPLRIMLVMLFLDNDLMFCEIVNYYIKHICCLR